MYNGFADERYAPGLEELKTHHIMAQEQQGRVALSVGLSGWERSD